MAQVADDSAQNEHVGSSLYNLDDRIDELLPKGLTPREICEEVHGGMRISGQEDCDLLGPCGGSYLTE